MSSVAVYLPSVTSFVFLILSEFPSSACSADVDCTGDNNVVCADSGYCACRIGYHSVGAHCRKLLNHARSGVAKHFPWRATFKILLLSGPHIYYVDFNYNLRCMKI